MTNNVYDNNEFFLKYQELRNNPSNYNSLVEQPAIKKLLPDLRSKTILDLGCGFGINCKDFIERGAAKVIGIFRQTCWK